MKKIFVKTTLTLSLLLMAAAPTAAFAGSNGEVSVPSGQSILKGSNSCFSNGVFADSLKKQSCYGFNNADIKFDGGKLQFVPNNNCQLQENKNHSCGWQNGANQNKPQKPGNGNDSIQKPGNGNDSIQKPGNGNDNIQKPGNTGGSSNIGAYENQVLTIVNQERSKAGVAPVRMNAKLSNVAEKKAEDMRDNNYFSHTSPTYGSPFDMMKQFGITYSAAGENIAKGQKTPESVMNAWMNSSGHRANILNSKYDQIGIGYTTDSKGNTYWVQMFMK